jgi:hypothetical protein
LGRVIHIEDVSPGSLDAGIARSSHMGRGDVNEHAEEVSAFDPSLLEVMAAVFVAYEIKEK